MAGEHGCRNLDDYLARLNTNRNLLQRARTSEDRQASLARISAAADCLLAEVEELFNRAKNEERRQRQSRNKTA